MPVVLLPPLSLPLPTLACYPLALMQRLLAAAALTSALSRWASNRVGVWRWRGPPLHLRLDALLSKGPSPPVLAMRWIATLAVGQALASAQAICQADLTEEWGVGEGTLVYQRENGVQQPCRRVTAVPAAARLMGSAQS
jgi:hypothetical protein